jgi:hypothetical protein
MKRVKPTYLYCEYVTTERWKTIYELDEDEIVKENYIIRSF